MLLTTSLAALVGVSGCAEPLSANVLQPVEYDGRALRAEWDHADEDRISVKLILEADDGDDTLYEGEIANGGQPVTWDNFRPVTARPPELILCVNGSGQPDLSVRIHTTIKTIITVERACKE